MVADRVGELEKEFIIWSNILDEELIRYSFNVGSYSREYLLDEDEFFHGLMQELDEKNEEYIRLTRLKWAHPDFENSSWRLNHILDLIYCEIESRKSR